MAIKRSDIKIYIAPVDTAPSALASSDVISGEIISHELSGGTRDTETQPAFGGFIDKEKPVEQYELSFEIVPSIDSAAAAARWEGIAFSQIGSTGIYTPGVGPADRTVGIQALSGTDVQSYAFNNCNVTEFTWSHSADDNRTANLTVKFSPADADGYDNLQSGALAITSLLDWTDATLQR